MLMSFSLWSLLIAGLLPYLTVGLAKASKGGYDNAHPRDWAAGLTDWRRRAYAAHANHFEFLPFYTAAILVAQVRLGPNAAVDLVAGGVILARIAYTIAYLLNRPTLRSIVWMLAIAGIVALFVLAARGA
jgi:uncharacterized MAPEG superfamily protein